MDSKRSLRKWNPAPFIRFSLVLLLVAVPVLVGFLTGCTKKISMPSALESQDPSPTDTPAASFSPTPSPTCTTTATPTPTHTQDVTPSFQVSARIGLYQSEYVDLNLAYFYGWTPMMYPCEPYQPSVNSCIYVQITRDGMYYDGEAAVTVSDGTQSYPVPLLDYVSDYILVDTMGLLEFHEVDFRWWKTVYDAALYGVLNAGNQPGGFVYQPGVVYTLDIVTPDGNFSASVTAPGDIQIEADGTQATWTHMSQVGRQALNSISMAGSVYVTDIAPLGPPPIYPDPDEYSYWDYAPGLTYHVSLYNASPIPGAIQEDLWDTNLSEVIAFEYRDQFIFRDGIPVTSPCD